MRSTASASRSAKARRWASSAKAAAASRPSARTVLRLIEPTAGDDPARRQRTSPGSAKREHAALPPADADHLPGPVLVAEPAHVGRRHRRRAAAGARHRATARTSDERVARICSTRSGLRRAQMNALSARIFRRPAAAHLHRPRAGAEPQADRRRRAGLGARRVDPGAGHQPDDGPAAREAASPTCSSRTTSRSSSTSATASR